MLRVVRILSVVLLSVCMLHAKAAAGSGKKAISTGGVKAQAAVAGFLVSGHQPPSISSGMYYSLGGFLNLDISRRFALLFELSVSAQNSRVQYDQASGNMVLCGIDIPIYALAYWTLHDSGRFYVGGGPFSCAGIYGRAKIGNRSLDLYEKRYADDGGAEISMVENFYSGFGLVVGYEFKNRIRVFLDYKISITDMVGFRNTSVRIYPHRLGFGIGYRFGK